MNDAIPGIKFTLREKIALGIIVCASALIAAVGVAGIVDYIVQRWFS